jgi:hypothetical protein
MAEVLGRESAYVSDLILKAPHNESAWNYLRGLVGLYGEKHTLAVYPTFADICIKVCSLPRQYFESPGSLTCP